MAAPITATSKQRINERGGPIGDGNQPTSYSTINVETTKIEYKQPGSSEVDKQTTTIHQRALKRRV